MTTDQGRRGRAGVHLRLGVPAGPGHAGRASLHPHRCRGSATGERQATYPLPCLPPNLRNPPSGPVRPGCLRPELCPQHAGHAGGRGRFHEGYVMRCTTNNPLPSPPPSPVTPHHTLFFVRPIRQHPLSSSIPTTFFVLA